MHEAASPLTQTWRRVWGLLIRATLVTLQRGLDVYSMVLRIKNGEWSSWVTWIFLVMLLITSLAMQMTMEKHWSARRGGRPYGWTVSTITAVLQMSVCWEMYDKISTHGPPRPARLPQNDLERPLLMAGSHPKKGSQGENVMRGVRKLCIINALEAMLSLWVHTSEVLTSGVARASIMVSLFSLAVGVADFVLYIWVLDAFVKENKKLVTFHYVVEIASRVPAVVLFHISYSKKHDYTPTYILLVVDILLTSTLLLFQVGRPVRRVVEHRRRSCCPSCIGGTRRKGGEGCFQCMLSKQSWLQFLYSLLVSFILFFLNIVFFDPGMIFQKVNKAFCIIKVVELLVMMFLMQGCITKARFSRSKTGLIVGVPVYWALAFEAAVVCINLLLVFWYIPRKRRQKDEHLVNQGDGGQATRDDFVTLATPRAVSWSELPEVDARSFLDRLDSIFQLLNFLSQCNGKNAGTCTTLLSVVVQELWDQMKADGTYRDDRGSAWRVEVAGDTLTCRQGATELRGFMVNHGQDVVLPQSASSVRWGHFDGTCIEWKGSPAWRRDVLAFSKFRASQDGLMHIILPQLAFALRWESQLELDKRPLLSFVITFAMTTLEKMDFVSEFFWALVCLSQDERVRDVYAQARGCLMDRLPVEAERKLIGQQLTLIQHLVLEEMVGRSTGSGAQQYKTERLRKILRDWSEHFTGSESVSVRVREFFTPREEERLQRAMASLLDGGATEDSSNREVRASLLNPKDQLHLPILPSSTYHGISIDDSEVISSKLQPIRLSCITESESPMGRSESTKETTSIMVKDGDDLRQDQLMLQLMDLMEFVWKEKLDATDFKYLERPKYKVLAVTPSFGYVKFVKDSHSLTDVLQASGGNLLSWLEQRTQDEAARDRVKRNFCGSVAAACVATYVLGIGDRHLENICIMQTGKVFHVDFGFVLGDDPKPCAPQVRLPQQVAEALLGMKLLDECFRLAGLAYNALRPFAGLFTSVLELTAAAGGAGCEKLAREAIPAIAGLRERLRVDEDDELRATEELLCLMRESYEGLASILIDKVHAAGLFWR